MRGVAASPIVMRHLALALLIAALAAPAAAQSYLARPQTIGGNPGPAHNYVCPNVDRGGALDCFLDAVRHLYTMCRHVKSIEIIEFGYERSDEGTNASKSEYCVDKQKGNIAKPYQAAMKEAKISKQAVDGLRTLHEYWVASLVGLKWRASESDEDYLVRTGLVYTTLDEHIDAIRTTVAEARTSAPASRTASAKVKR